MKTIRILGGAAVILAAAALTPVALGDTAVQSTTTYSDGTVSEFSPSGDSIVIHGESGAAPLRYSYSKSTTIVDESGNPVDVSVVKSGVPVQVYYEREGDGMVARRIIVRRHGGVVEHERTTTTTTTTGGDRDRDHDHDKDHDRDHDH